MRIIKYLFLLFLLSLVALTIYIATQKGDFTVESSKVINSPKTTVFNYVNDLKNWPKFSSWIISDASITPSFSPITIGKESSFTWKGNDNNGTIQTLYTKINDSIVQKMDFNNTESEVYWGFKDTIGGTKVTWKSKGKMDFISKVNSFFNLGTTNTLSKAYVTSLSNLNKKLDFENTSYSIKIIGIVNKLGTYYLRQSFTSKISDITQNANAIFPKITAFCKQNNIVQSGKPFIIYHTYDTINNKTKVSFCIPIKDQIFTSAGSDITSGKLVAFNALKTSLTGNYIYKDKALAKTNAYTISKNIQTGSTFSHLEIYTRGKNENLSPSKWQTDIYFPITPKSTHAAVPIPATVKTISTPSTIPSTIAPSVPVKAPTTVPVIVPVHKKVYKKTIKDSLAKSNQTKHESEFDF